MFRPESQCGMKSGGRAVLLYCYGKELGFSCSAKQTPGTNHTTGASLKVMVHVLAGKQVYGILPLALGSMVQRIAY